MSDDEQSSEATPLTFEQARRRFPNIHLLKSRKFSRLDAKSQNQADRWVLILDGIDANDLGPGEWKDRYAFVADAREFLKVAAEIQRKLGQPEPTMEDRILAELKAIRELLEKQGG